MRTLKTAALLSAVITALVGVSGLTPQSADAVTSCSSGSVNTTSNGNVRIVTFTAPSSGDGTCTWDVPENVFVVDYLVVAGGGGGGSGGGGGGRVIYSDNPQIVTPGNSISITVGAGGTGGKGGIASGGNFPANGNNSIFGSITAIGGGAGGSWNRYANPPGDEHGAVGGSSGGDAYDASTTTGQTSSGTTVVGATTLGNSGGSSPGGSYSAGGGGGGATGAGGNARRPTLDGAPTFNQYQCDGGGTFNCSNSYYGGGRGGAGYTSSISGSSVEYGCGGGGGINSNRNVVVTNAGGAAGCSSAGRGSSWGFNNGTVNTADNATSAAAGFGGGGGGTDPEDIRGGAGGSGVVILRYTLVDANCPNNGTNSATAPLACPAEVTVQANGVSSNVSVLGSPISFSSGGTLSVRSRPTANPTSGNMTATDSGSNIVISVPSGSSLIGGTYPVVYRITQGASTSDSYILVRVEDPTQLTPGTIPLDPRETGITFPRIELGAAPNVLVCLTLQDTNTDGISLAAAASTGVTIANPNTRRITFSGTNSAVEAALNVVTVTGSGTGILVPTNATRVLDVNVTNTNNGGNGSCSVGTASTITLNKLSLTTGQRLTINLE